MLMFYLIALPVTAAVMTVALFFAEGFSEAELSFVQKLIIGSSCAAVYFIPFIGGWAAIILCAFLLTSMGGADSFGASLMVAVLMVVTTRLMFVFLLAPLLAQ
jgi:hypothetical protein